MANVYHQTFEDFTAIDPASRDSLYALTSSSHNFLEAHNFPQEIGLTAHSRQDFAVLPQHFRPLCRAVLSERDGSYRFDVQMPVVDRAHLVNQIKYDFYPPVGKIQTGVLAILGVTRFAYERKATPFPDSKLTIGGIAKGIASSLDSLRRGKAGWTLATKNRARNV